MSQDCVNYNGSQIQQACHSWKENFVCYEDKTLENCPVHGRLSMVRTVVAQARDPGFNSQWMPVFHFPIIRHINVFDSADFLGC